MKKSIETKIKLNVIFIYVLVVLTCGGGFLYFYSSWRNIAEKKQSVETYNNELTNVNELVTAINEAQAEVNLFVITERRKHLKQFQEQLKGISSRIDSIKNAEKDLGVDTILLEITQLLKQKEQSIIQLTRQFTLRNPIDSLSETLSSFSNTQSNETDSAIVVVEDPPAKEPKRGFWKRLFSSKKEKQEKVVRIDTIKVVKNDTLPINQIIQQTRINYDQHISAIENQINLVVLTDQHISTRISELVTMLYNQIILLRLQDVKESEALLRQNNISALIVGGVALILIIISLILILRNVKKGYTVRKALEQANQRTRQIMESRHKLLLSVSHDVKTPLNSMLGYIDVYKRNGLLTDAEVIPLNSSGNHIQALLHNLLEFSGLEKGSVTLVPRNFLLTDMCKELCEMFIPLAEKKSLNFNYLANFPDDLILYSDRLKTKQILSNILSNAIKYTKTGSVSFEVKYTNDSSLRVSITDTGVGIPEDKQEELFKPFSRIDESSVLDSGHGLGLFVVKGLIELFGGAINYQSVQGKGTRVTIILPVKKGEKSETDIRTKNILLVDDDDVFLDMLSRLCQQLGHKVTCCNNRGELEKELKNISSYQCIMTDMEMGSFTGKNVLKKVKELDKEMPVILITGRTDFSMSDILAEGFTDFLSKPVNIRQLHALVGGKIDYNSSGNLNRLLENDKKAIQEVTEHFIISTVNNIISLRNAAKEKDSNKAQYLCHKMLPMFLQIEAPRSITQTLQLVDSLRGKTTLDSSVWQRIDGLIGEIENYLSCLQEGLS
jgi:Signal transduction histidine kinase